MLENKTTPRFPIKRLSEVGILGFFIISATLVYLRKDYDPLSRYLSEYAVGPGGWAMQAAFLLLGLSSLNLALGFLGPLAPRMNVGLALSLALWSLSVLVAAVFPVNPQGASLTVGGTFHLVAAGTGFLALFAAMVLAARRFRRSEDWQALSTATTWFAVLTPAAFILESSLFATIGLVGVGHWLLFGLVGAWLYVIARHFRRLTRGARPPA